MVLFELKKVTNFGF